MLTFHTRWMACIDPLSLLSKSEHLPNGMFPSCRMARTRFSPNAKKLPSRIFPTCWMVWSQAAVSSDQKGHVAVHVREPQPEQELVPQAHERRLATPPQPLQDKAKIHPEAASDVPAGNSHVANGAGEKPKAAHGMTLPFTPLSLTFHRMNYFVPLPKVGPSSVCTPCDVSRHTLRHIPRIP